LCQKFTGDNEDEGAKKDVKLLLPVLLVLQVTCLKSKRGTSSPIDGKILLSVDPFDDEDSTGFDIYMITEKAYP
jgi:hypothetical protein